MAISSESCDPPTDLLQKASKASFSALWKWLEFWKHSATNERYLSWSATASRTNWCSAAAPAVFSAAFSAAEEEAEAAAAPAAAAAASAFSRLAAAASSALRRRALPSPVVVCFWKEAMMAEEGEEEELVLEEKKGKKTHLALSLSKISPPPPKKKLKRTLDVDPERGSDRIQTPRHAHEQPVHPCQVVAPPVAQQRRDPGPLLPEQRLGV